MLKLQHHHLSNTPQQNNLNYNTFKPKALIKQFGLKTEQILKKFAASPHNLMHHFG